MTMDIAGYLREARESYRAVVADWENPIGPKDVLLNDYLNLDVSLSTLMLRVEAINNDVPHNAVMTSNAEVKALYATAFAQFLLISLKQQWTHLMVLEDEDLAKFSRFPQMRLAHQFIGIKTMLLNSYHQKRQADFSHAWRSFLKLGLVELKLTQDDIDQEVRAVLDASDLDSPAF
ncbi:dUTPase [Weissella confusa]|uniref:dUTPase n=1 Tax=Weissella confusa TaxID=1583 RepID=UPI001897F5AC|nr:dUTPase [Weissella confusa]MCT2911280.1 dUTPase [Weissella confusa]QYU57421.1 dUTPase [Weissella confusa]